MIRLATKEDQKDILKLYDDAKEFIKRYDSPQWQDGYPNKQSFNDDLLNNSIYVNIKNDKIVGVATILSFEPTYEGIYDGNWLNNEPYKVIHRITTSIDHLGNGYAKDFINFINEELSCNNIRIDTHELNEPMIKFLIKNGFEYCGIICLDQPTDRKRLAYHKEF